MTLRASLGGYLGGDGIRHSVNDDGGFSDALFG